jgi:hypothetical protein
LSKSRASKPTFDFKRKQATETEDRITAGRVPIAKVREWVLKRFGANSPLGRVMLAEDDSLSISDFLHAIRVWVVLLNGDGAD